MEGILNMLSFRSKRIDQIIQNSTETVNNIFYDDINFKEPLENLVKKLEKILEQNNSLLSHFGKLGKETEKIDEMEKFLGYMEEIDSIVGL
jgi:hypothetical protein